MKLTEADVRGYYEGKGYTPEAAAAIAGHLSHESAGLNPNAVGDKGTAFGLGQWRGDRLDNLKSYSEETGRDYRDPFAQMDFVDHEMRNGLDRGAARAYEALNRATTLDEAVVGFMHFERPQGYSVRAPERGLGLKDRLSRAREAFTGTPRATVAAIANVTQPAQRAVRGLIDNVVQPGLGLLNLTQNRAPVAQVPSAQMSFAAPAGATRNRPAADDITGRVAASVAALGPEYGFVTTSAAQPTRSMGGARVGSTRHDVDPRTGVGRALDGALTRDGVAVSPSQDRQAYMDVMTNMAERGVQGIGHYGWGVHADTVAPGLWGPDTRSASVDPGFAAAVQQGRGLASLAGAYPSPTPAPTQTAPVGAVARADLPSAVPASLLDQPAARAAPAPSQSLGLLSAQAAAPASVADKLSSVASFDTGRFATPALGIEFSPSIQAAMEASRARPTMDIAAPSFGITPAAAATMPETKSLISSPAPTTEQLSLLGSASLAAPAAQKTSRLSPAVETAQASAARTNALPSFDDMMASRQAATAVASVPAAPAISAPQVASAPSVRSAPQSAPAVSAPMMTMADPTAGSRGISQRGRTAAQQMAELDSLISKDQRNQQIGSVLGGLLGSLGGPLGMLAGSFIGSRVAGNRNALGFFPDAPKANPNSRGGGGGLTSFGEAAARGEYGGQAQSAAQASRDGRGGLY